MRFSIAIILISICSLAFSADIPAPPDPSAPATAVQVQGHWETQADGSAIWQPTTWQVQQGTTTVAMPPPAEPAPPRVATPRVVYVQAPATAPQVVYVQQPAPPAQVVYVDRPIYAPPMPRQVAIYGDCDRIYGNQYYGGGGIVCGSNPLPQINYHWQIYGNQRLRHCE